MDGGGRLVGSLSGGGGALLADGPSIGLQFPSLFHTGRSRVFASAQPTRRSPRERRPAPGLFSRSWVGLVFCMGVLGGAGLYGSHLGGGYDAFVAGYGAPQDIAANLLGFEIDSISVSGLSQLAESEVLEAAGISDRSSLLFLDAADVRSRLKAVPLVRDVTVRKLFPNRLMLDFVERDAAALWQKDGLVSVVAADGVAIDTVHDARFNALPFVVGDSANAHLPEFLDIVASAGDLRDRIRAGIYVGGRRWTLQMDSGVEVMLPEIDPKTALARLAAIDRTTKIVDKDVLSLDLRIPGRITARLSEDAAAARAAMLAKKPKKVGKE